MWITKRTGHNKYTKYRIIKWNMDMGVETQVEVEEYECKVCKKCNKIVETFMFYNIDGRQEDTTEWCKECLDYYV